MVEEHKQKELAHLERERQLYDELRKKQEERRMREMYINYLEHLRGLVDETLEKLRTQQDA